MPTQAIGGSTSPDERYRLECADRLCNWVAGPFTPVSERPHRLTPKDLIHRLDTECGVRVSRQAVSYWLNGTWLPSRRNQAAVAKVLGVPVTVLFPPQPFEAAS